MGQAFGTTSHNDRHYHRKEIGETAGLHGVGFMIKKAFKNNIVNFTGISERVAILKLKFGNMPLTIIQTYEPTENSSDFNAKIGHPKTEENLVMGKYGYGKLLKNLTRYIIKKENKIFSEHTMQLIKQRTDLMFADNKSKEEKKNLSNLFKETRKSIRKDYSMHRQEMAINLENMSQHEMGVTNNRHSAVPTSSSYVSSSAKPNRNKENRKETISYRAYAASYVNRAEWCYYTTEVSDLNNASGINVAWMEHNGQTSGPFILPSRNLASPHGPAPDDEPAPRRSRPPNNGVFKSYESLDIPSDACF
ncbi:hypothetical protein MSG28_004897 [Choristoneura fumiferana]|uniref:Uncharacterized protein n=1 Tax=Choristoneura fumiferana TaxID=7141 RepID=A0ACC0JP16_CHOFU|nr:hypothetical protein MSG28_004897 [Choristoneura fumiferana]